MENREYKYDAFISYRHCDLDKYVAENLHKVLETYELPKALKKKLNIQGRTIKRVFRDQDELPLSSNLEDPIIEALKDSKYLIVICSPRLKDSLWCKKEIETFKKLRGRKNIFCVLIEGEPDESFPEEVLYDEVMVKTKDGKAKIEKTLVEPLAADVRGENKGIVLKKIKEEKLRLIAPMYNLEYDDLKQRHKLRKQKQILNISLGVTFASLAFAIFALTMFIKINTQANILASHQALSLARESVENLKIDNRYDAIKNAYYALTEFEGVKMPYTADAEYALSESLGVYDVGSSYKSITEIKTKGVADFVKSSADNKYAAVYDESEEITLFDSKTLNVIANYKANGSVSSERIISFIGNDKLAFINEKGNVVIVNTSDGKVVKEFEKEKWSYISVAGSSNGELLSYTDGDNLHIYSVKDDREVTKSTSSDKYMKELYYSDDSKYLFASTTVENFSLDVKDSMTVHVISTSDGKEINKISFTAGYMNGIMTIGDNAYILVNNSYKNKYNTIITSYNYLNDKTNWSKSYDDVWGKYLNRSYEDGKNHIAIASYDKVSVFNAKDGDLIQTFHTDSEIIDLYSFMNTEIYLIFLKNGHVNYINMEYKNSIEYKGKYEFNMDSYIKVAISQDGYLLIPNNENRVILYEPKTNNDIKEEDVKIDYPKDESITPSELDKVKEEYDLRSKNLVNNVFYDTNQELLFVNYTNEDVAIYSTKDKKLLKYLNKVGKVNHYYGKDKYGRIYLGDISDSYIIDKDYNKVGHIKSLAKLEDDRVIISNNSKYYSVKIYTLDDLKNKAKDYLREEDR